MSAYRRFTYTDRLKLESLHNAGVCVKIIAQQLQFHVSSIYRELKTGYYMHRNSDWTETQKYSANLAQQKADYQSTSKGVPLKIGNDYDFLHFVEYLIVDKHYSPDAALGYIRRHNHSFKTMVCTTTLYHYIDIGLFPRLTNKHLVFKGTRRNTYNKVKPIKKPPKGDSIEKRPEEINNRSTFGHWELDSVIGQREKGQTLLVLTERKTRFEIILRSQGKTAQNTVQALNTLERQLGKYFPRVFRSITIDNGTEFSDCSGMESSCRAKRKRTKCYYCHPYCSGERGSNEKQNQMIRWHIYKGTRIETYTDKQIHETQLWLNNYPRRMFHYQTAQELFDSELSKLNIPEKILKNFRASY